MEKTTIMKMHYFCKLWHSMMDKYSIDNGVAPPVGRILIALSNGPMSQKDLVEKLHLKAPTISLTIKEMIFNKLIVKQDDSDDLRKQILSLTDYGISISEICASKYKKLDDSVMSILSLDEQKSLDELISKLIKGVNCSENS